MEEQLSITLIKNLSELQSVREIRNECKDFMTRNTENITEEQQISWYQKLDIERNWLFIADKIYHGSIVVPVGYGYNRVEDGCVLLTGGLIQSERGKGNGRTLFSFLLNHAKTTNFPIKLEVLKSNFAAQKLYLSLDFVEIGQNETSIKMEYKNDSPV